MQFIPVNATRDITDTDVDCLIARMSATITDCALIMIRVRAIEDIKVNIII